MTAEALEADPQRHKVDRSTSAGRVHLVYPHGDRISTPDAIGRELGRRLKARYEVVRHDWWELGVIRPEPGDVLLGHPHPDPRSVFRQSLRQPGWRRKLMMAPFHHGDLRQIAFEDPLIGQCDQFLAITGPHWVRTLDRSLCSHWQPKMIPLEHAVDRRDFPALKHSFASPGRRRIVYIGHSGRGKGTDYLARIAALVPETEFGWIGSGSRPVPGLTAYGQQDFATDASKDLLRSFDFLMMTGNADSNPTTILEAMAWGLIPICTPTCGYEGIPGIANVPVRDAPAAAAVVRELLAADESELLRIQAANWALLETHYNWDRFARDVATAIESEESPPLLPESLRRKLTFTYYDVTSPYGRVVFGRPGRFMRRLLRRWRLLRTRARNRLGRAARSRPPDQDSRREAQP
jgi:glycosyltransferase involved in cell wall biosynthesis